MSFEFQEVQVEEVKCLQLKKEGETVMEILPDHGATLNQLKFKHGDDWISVVQGYADYKEVPSFPGSRSGILFPFPNRLKEGKYSYQGIQYQFPTEEKHHGNAIHGMVRKEAFQLEDYHVNEEGGSAKLSYLYSGDRNYYPFPFGLYLEFRYSNNQLETFFTVENRGNTKMPVGLGWHPYFKVGQTVIDEVELKLPIVSQVMLNEINLPTGEVKDYLRFENFEPIADSNFDDCFKLIMQDRSAIYSFSQGFGLALEPSKEFLFLQVYIPGDRQSIAIEPMNCNVDAFNNQEGLMNLEKGSTYKASFTIRAMGQQEYEEIKADFDD